MGLLNQFKRVMGLESRAVGHDRLRTTISFTPPQRGNGNAVNGKANGRSTETAGNGHSNNGSSRSAAINGRVTMATEPEPANRPAIDDTQAIEVAGLETSVDLAATQDIAVQEAVAENSTKKNREPSAPAEFVSLQFGLDDASMYEFEDYEEAAELLEDGNCRRCFVEDHAEVHVPVDPFSGLRICPECKATYRAAAAE